MVPQSAITAASLALRGLVNSVRPPRACSQAAETLQPSTNAAATWPPRTHGATYSSSTASTSAPSSAPTSTMARLGCG
jgi:hypothetical protein